MRDRTNLIFQVARPSAVVAILASCLLVGSCHGGGGGGGSGSPSPGPVVTSSSLPGPAVTSSSLRGTVASITSPRQGSRVSWAQQVTGSVTGLPAGTSAWLVIQPGKPTGFWPQPGPLYPDTNGNFVAQATFGLPPPTSRGEQFILMLVEATAAASQQLKRFTSTLQPTGLPGLPDGTRVLTQVSVTRS